ncbi:hypothetical protein D920_02718 [Enterococcus faecalis 13-SD-W-01]|nr:hypothetical protein D920_02718 [Enterococcus faecalis 13-SD-W-01]
MSILLSKTHHSYSFSYFLTKKLAEFLKKWRVFLNCCFSFCANFIPHIDLDVIFLY